MSNQQFLYKIVNKIVATNYCSQPELFFKHITTYFLKIINIFLRNELRYLKKSKIRIQII